MPELPLFPNASRMSWPRSRPPDPTPRKTNPPPKTRIRNTNAHFAWLRRRGKNIVFSATRCEPPPALRPAGRAWRASRCAERAELEGLARREDVRTSRSGASRQDNGSQLLEEIEGRRRCGAVRADTDPCAGGAELGERRHATAEHAVRTRTVRDAGRRRSKQADLVLVEHDAVGSDDV